MGKDYKGGSKNEEMKTSCCYEGIESKNELNNDCLN